VSILAQRPRSDQYYVQLVKYTPDAVVHHERFPSLPRSILQVLGHGGVGVGSHLRLLPRAVLWEATVPVDGVAMGAQEVPIQVRP